MTTFDLIEVRDFVADLDARMRRCDNGEGMECATLEASLRHHATLCCEFRESVRQWGRAVFAGRVAFDAAVERIWREEGLRLFRHAVEMLADGQKAEVPCYVLESQGILQAALWQLHELLADWVTPQLAVGPAARQGLPLDPTAAEKARALLSALPPLPADWQPADPRQRVQYKRLGKR